MTKKNALATAQHLDLRCNEPYIFAVKVGAGCLTSSKCHGDNWALLTLFINLIEQIMRKLKTDYRNGFRELLCRALLEYLADTVPEKPQEVLSDKQRARRIKNTERTIAELEAVL